MSIYTKSGDTGRASTETRRDIPKDSPIFDLLGTLDELSSALGLAKTKAGEITPIIEEIQRDLIALSEELAGGKRFASAAQTAKLESAIDSVAEKLAEPKGFVLPGKTEAGAALDLARTVARRGERCLIASSHNGGVTRDMMAWLNRLSDLLYMLARLWDATGDSGIKAGTAPLSAESVANGFCETAITLCRAVRQRAAEMGVRAVTAVCDAGGTPVCLQREEDAFIASVDIAVNKAFTSVSLKMTTEELSHLAQPGQSLYGIQFTNNNRIVIFGGGVPLIRNGRIVGGFGVSGGTAEQDTALGNYAKEYFEKELG